MPDWILDLAVACLLVATIAYCAALHRRLGLLRQDRDELARFVAAFDGAVRRADAAIGGLGRAGDDAAKRLAGPVAAAGRLAEDLRALVERGERAAAGIEASRRGAPATGSDRREDEPDAEELHRILEALR